MTVVASDCRHQRDSSEVNLEVLSAEVILLNVLAYVLAYVLCRINGDSAER